ncbi:MAG: bis(5'-nucleosyl)-tetraphosphatase (symmetrical) YqeK [Clostridiales bacterium]
MNNETGKTAEEICRRAGCQKEWQSLRDKLQGQLKPRRFNHSLAVADEAVAMGHLFGGDLVKLALAGLLHDSAKELSNEQLLALAEAQGLITDPAERENPSILHGPVGAWRACREWGIADPVILEAIRLHTVGGPDMSLEACIIFMADLIEPGRAYNGVDILRRLCRQDLRAAMIEAIEQTLVYLERKKLPLHQGTLLCLAWLKEERGIVWKAKN